MRTDMSRFLGLAAASLLSSAASFAGGSIPSTGNHATSAQVGFTRSRRNPINPDHLRINTAQAFGRVLNHKVNTDINRRGRNGMTREQFEWNQAVDMKKGARHQRRIKARAAGLHHMKFKKHMQYAVKAEA